VYSKIYEGSINEIIDYSIDLYLLLERWKKNHPLYTYRMVVEGERLYLTLIKNKSENGKTYS